MAEALANHMGHGRVNAWSAGSMPLGKITPLTFQVLREKGMDLDGHWSKGLKSVPVETMDVVVGMGMGCEVPCPVPTGFKGKRLEWNIPDPYGCDVAYFRSVRDLIERQVRALLQELEEHHRTIKVAPPRAEKKK